MKSLLQTTQQAAATARWHVPQVWNILLVDLAAVYVTVLNLIARKPRSAKVAVSVQKVKYSGTTTSVLIFSSVLVV
jgi:hypothetical protein